MANRSETGTAEAGDHVLAVELARLADPGDRAVRAVDQDGPDLRVHHPDQPGPGLEIFLHLAVGLVMDVIRRDHLDRQVGRELDMAIGHPLVRRVGPGG